jgi:ketopantoate hydroxymethyltransferase
MWRLRGILPALGIGPFGDMLHGQVVVAKQGGGYETMDVQRGSVTAVSSSSITVKSSDGFSATYVVTSSTNVIAESAGIGSVKVGDTVMVSAVVNGKTANAVVVADASAIRAGRAQFKSAAFPARAAQLPPSAPNS